MADPSRGNGRGWRTALPYAALVAVIAGFGNFLWFFAESASLGGDALNGFQRGGQYFVGSHGSYTESRRRRRPVVDIMMPTWYAS